MNWTGIWNRLWRFIDMPGDCYFGGPRFLNAVREVDPDLPQYGDLMETLRRTGKSTSRRDYFRETFMALDEERRVRVVGSILDRFGNLMRRWSRRFVPSWRAARRGPSV